jgi:hypothetical protein
LAKISLSTRQWGLLASPLPISEEQKTNARKLSLVSCELVQRLIATLDAVTYNDKGGREKDGRY